VASILQPLIEAVIRPGAADAGDDFDGDIMNAFAPPQGEAARLSGKIKWFNRSKGFGFIVADDGAGDVFLPLSVLERSGFGEAPDGASVTFEWVQGPKGRAAVQLLDLDISTATPRAARERMGERMGERGGERGFYRPRDNPGYGGGNYGGGGNDDGDNYGGGDASSGPGGLAESLDGVVKWYDPARGFGFILPNDGSKDIFVHVTALRRSGIDALEPGQPVRMMVAQAKRGREASSIELLG
jgi:CspA family cold shock protein